MKKNIGSTDKIVRIVLTIAIGYFAYSTEFETGWIPFILLLATIKALKRYTVR